MAMRLTGLMSGMDTDSIIQELVAVRRTKVDNTVKAQTKLEWKQEAWKELNNKLKSLQSKYISNMRLSSAYSKMTSKVSDSSVADVITGDGAVIGTQELKVRDLAKTAYLTGAELTGANGQKVTARTALKDIKGAAVVEGAEITVKIGNKEHKISDITENTTISDVISKLKEFGLNASFDENNQRMFVSSKESGAKNNFTISGTGMALTALGLSEKNNGAKKIEGQDAVIELNGATFKSSTNVFKINGLTITALEETKDEEFVTISTERDTTGIYDMLKGFLKEYNSIINEMDKLYNADGAKGYEPLTDEEKESLSESEIEKYEKKIKDGLLRRDENLSTISSAMKSIMSSGFEIGGKTMYLHDFGINTLGYFSAADNEKNAYYIDGDEDTDSVAGKTNKLKQMIGSDPSTVIDFFTQLSNKLYDEMSNQSKSVNGYRSFGNFYDDKKMKEDYTDYTTKIAELEQKLADYEDSWYKKFAAMEKAMAEMQSNTSSVTALLGG